MMILEVALDESINHVGNKHGYGTVTVMFLMVQRLT